jgi:hypothetical protein
MRSDARLVRVDGQEGSSHQHLPGVSAKRAQTSPNTPWRNFLFTQTQHFHDLFVTCGTASGNRTENTRDHPGAAAFPVSDDGVSTGTEVLQRPYGHKTNRLRKKKIECGRPGGRW